MNEMRKLEMVWFFSICGGIILIILIAAIGGLSSLGTFRGLVTAAILPPAMIVYGLFNMIYYRKEIRQSYDDRSDL